MSGYVFTAVGCHGAWAGEGGVPPSFHLGGGT